MPVLQSSDRVANYSSVPLARGRLSLLLLPRIHEHRITSAGASPACLLKLAVTRQQVHTRITGAWL